MHHVYTVAAKAVLLAAFLLGPSVSFSQPSLEKTVQFGGQMHGAAEKCGGYTDDQLRDMKKSQKAQAAEMGMAGGQFEDHFQLGYEEGLSRLSQVSSEEKAAFCEQIKAMADLK